MKSKEVRLVIVMTGANNHQAIIASKSAHALALSAKTFFEKGHRRNKVIFSIEDKYGMI